tara:strand:- start:164 stop:1627 length:1464 start_codon:yes stop_codon:yes gene_type:complete
VQKILLILISSLFFYNISYAEEYSNSWKLEIECKDRGYKWWESTFVVEVIDNKFFLRIDKRWDSQKNILFEGLVEKNKVIIKQTFERTDRSGKGIGFYKGKIKDNSAKLKGYRQFKGWDPLSCKGNFYKVDRLPIFAALEYLDNASREIIKFTSYDPVGSINIINKSYINSPVNISGELILPKSGNNIPVVVVIHSSSGPSEFSEIKQWTWRNGFNNELLKNNIGIFQIDSFTGRGVENTHSDQSTVSIHAGEMDAFQALKLLEDHPRVDSTRLGITGLSRGGIASYQVTEKRFSDAVLGPNRYFKASLPMAIDCYIRFEQPLMTPTKTLFLLGSNDDYTPPEGCVNWVKDVKVSQGESADVEIIVKEDWVHGFYGDIPITICDSCVVFNNQACQADLPNGMVYNNEGLPANDLKNFFIKTKGKKTYDELVETLSSPDATWSNAWKFYYELYKAMYKSCATKGPKVGGDHAQETIDIAISFFVESLK